jgi:N6-adenosine-specific RNA methylase IME4
MAIQKRTSNLPAKLEDITKFVLIGREKLVAVRAAIRAIDKIGIAKDVREQKLEEGQMLGGALLDAEAKIGELLKDLPSPAGSKIGKRGVEKILPEGISHKLSHYCQQLAEHPDIIEQVKAEAAESEDIPTRTEVLRRIRLNQPKPEQKPLPDNKYKVIYADPPWCYGDKLVEGYGTVEHHYPPMSIDEICKMNVKDIALPESVLFLWVTSPLLEECFEVINAWGFEYKSSFVWDKVKHNYGHYNSVRHELLLLCTRGSCLPEIKELEDSVVSIERGKHSEKPEHFRKLIDKLYPTGKRIELFARKKTCGWNVFGNEVS